MADLDTVMRALSAPTRREILGLVWDRELPAGDIAAAFALSAATISEHLGVLREAGLVEMTRVGTSRRYRARPSALVRVRVRERVAAHRLVRPRRRDPEVEQTRARTKARIPMQGGAPESTA